MPEKQVQLDAANGPVTISIGPGALHAVQYSLFLFDPAGSNVLQTQTGFITDRRFDDIPLGLAPAGLDGCALKWVVDVTTVRNTGDDEPYQVFVEVSQNGQMVPGGDVFGPPNQGTFNTTLTYSDYVRLRA